MEDYGYPVSRMVLEYEITFGREKKRADIVSLIRFIPKRHISLLK